MSQRFRRVITQPRSDRNPCVTVDHKGIVRVVDDCSKFHLQNSVELLNDGIDIELESPCHHSSPSPWRDPGSSIRYYGVSTDWQHASSTSEQTVRLPGISARAGGVRPPPDQGNRGRSSETIEVGARDRTTRHG